MIRYVCDKCGKEAKYMASVEVEDYEGKRKRHFKITTITEYHLCPKCISLLQEYLGREK